MPDLSGHVQITISYPAKPLSLRGSLVSFSSPLLPSSPLLSRPVMPLRITSAPVSGVKKRKSATQTRPRISPFANHARSKPSVRSSSGLKSDDSSFAFDDTPLQDLGLSRHFAETAPVDNVLDALHLIRDNMFEDLPERAGMNSTRIAQVLNFRRSLPPLVSVAHVHTLLDQPTMVEREVMELATAGKIRRLIVPGRGNDAAGLGDCLVLSEDWERLVRESGLEDGLKEKFLTVLSRIGNTCAIPGAVFSASEYTALVRAGFIVSSSSLAKGTSSLPSLPTLPTTSPTPAASRTSSTSALPEPPSQPQPQFHTATLFLSLPNTGPYLKLLGTGRDHLLSLLKKSPSGEAPLYLLRDRWDGAVESQQSFSVAKRARGEFAGILPGKTKKWKDLYGMGFRWVLEEAVGAGLVEIFETGSVGPGIRRL
ncbi:serine-threonine protein kinase 19-domain-containing protein [Aspergillus karnatakaensis]|uniref:Stk19 family serine/threonine-protein kinase n=1 Tax=Aspergillus karnatakaensis TaxID=1810916 RepID=UPI003CCDE9E7